MQDVETSNSPVKALVHKRVSEKWVNTPVLRGRLLKLLQKADAAKGVQCWRYRHVDAFVGITSPYVLLLCALERQLEIATNNWGHTPIGQDTVLGQNYAEIIRGLRGLLNGDVGRRMDPGELDGYLCDLAAHYEVELE